MDPNDDPPPIKGVVIITLPPPDNPSLGKTITTFTFFQNHPPELQHELHLPIPSSPSPNPETHISFPLLILGVFRIILGLLGISIFAYICWVSLYSDTPLKSQESDEKNDGDDGPFSFVFPLYPKLGFGEVSKRYSDVELKLGRFVEAAHRDDGIVASLDDGVNTKKQQQRVIKKLAIDSSTILPVRGNVYPYGLFYTYMQVGNPPKPYFLDVDTGSDLTWVQCDAPCTSCAKGANSLYKPTKGKIVPSKDSLCEEIQRNQKSGYCEACQQCDYEIEYADQSFSTGVLAKDEIHLMVANGSTIKPNVVFGCGYDQQGLLLNSLDKTDGVLGLGASEVSLPSQLATKGIIKNVVGHCLSSDGGGGYMFLGDDFVPRQGMRWVPMLHSPSMKYYHTNIVRMSYGSGLLSLGGVDSEARRVIFDSGSSYTYFTKEAYSDLVASLKHVYDEGLVEDASDSTLPICWRADFPTRSIAEVKKLFKPLTLQFRRKWWIASTELIIPPEGYLIISNKGNVCLGILDGSKVHDGSTFILGDVSLRGQVVVYDNVNQKIGWGRSKCVKPEGY